MQIKKLVEKMEYKLLAGSLDTEITSLVYLQLQPAGDGDQAAIAEVVGHVTICIIKRLIVSFF